ncbi:MAG TPA: DUF5615 family PIN-like protein [Thermoanaerobaculia bacterium]
MIRLYLDEDTMERALLLALRTRGLDVESVLDADRSGYSDLEQLEYAAAHERVPYTNNVGDFHRLHWEFMDSGRSHSGILLVPQQRYSVGEQLRRVMHLASSLSAEQMKNRLEFLSSWS